MTRDERILPTKKDEQAFKEILTRAIYPISSTITNIQKTSKNNKQCESKTECGNKADYKIQREDDTQFAQHICITCIETQIQNWEEQMLEDLKKNLKRYKTAKKL